MNSSLQLVPLTLAPVHAAAPVSGDRLDSWKEIAAYLKRGARTLQRWEREVGLPVHRLQPDKLGTVYAYKSELDAWWSQRDVASQSAVPAGVRTPSLAVLPFTDMSRDNDQAYFCDGLAEEIINTMTRMEGLRIASRTSSFQFRDAHAGSREIGRRLGVDALLEGSIRKAGNQVRVTVRLMDAHSGFQLWAQRYDRELADVFATQDEVAQAIATELTETLAQSRSDSKPAA